MFIYKNYHVILFLPLLNKLVAPFFTELKPLLVLLPILVAPFFIELKPLLVLLPILFAPFLVLFLAFLYFSLK